MARGKTHDRINLLVGSIVTGVLIGLERNTLVVAGFVFGFLVSTLIISPDLDLGPKKRTRWLQFFLYPYAIFFKHRGSSHSLLFGTLTRITYGVVVFLIMTFVLSEMKYIEFGAMDILHWALVFIRGYDYSLVEYKFFTWIYMGMLLADMLHICVDGISTRWNRFLRKIF